MKRLHFISPFLAVCACFIVLAMICLTTPAAAQTADESSQGNALDSANEVVSSTAGGSMISLTKEATDLALGNAATKSFGAAWQANKMGASSATVGGLLEKSADFKSASSTLGIGSTVIDHAGYGFTAAGEIAGGYYAQGFVTIADGLGKSFVSGIASAAGASIGGFHGAVFGTAVGPVGTVAGGALGGIAGSVAGGNLGSEAWDVSMGKLTSTVKDWIAVRDDARKFREMSGPLMQGMTPEKIHAAWLKYKKELDDKNKMKVATVKVTEKEKVAPPVKPQPIKVKEQKAVPPAQPKPIEKDDGRFVANPNGTVLDTRTGLMWAATDSGLGRKSSKNWLDGAVNWKDAKSYCENYRGGGYSDWRMPTQDELARLYDAGKSYYYRNDEASAAYVIHLTPLIELSGHCSWASETRPVPVPFRYEGGTGNDRPLVDFEAALFCFTWQGSRGWEVWPRTDTIRALPVRSGK